MTYIRNPRDSLIWESDGDWNGKFMARDGTLHDSPEEALKRDAALALPDESPLFCQKPSSTKEDHG